MPIVKERDVELTDLAKLIGKKVVEVAEFNRSLFDTGFVITFDNGTILTAQDGEYGDNAFRLEYTEEKSDTVSKDYISRTPEEWQDIMRDKPCYCPALPFYDFCINYAQPVKRLNCGECLEERGLKDYIE